MIVLFGCDAWASSNGLTASLFAPSCPCSTLYEMAGEWVVVMVGVPPLFTTFILLLRPKLFNESY